MYERGGDEKALFANLHVLRLPAHGRWWMDKQVVCARDEFHLPITTWTQCNQEDSESVWIVFAMAFGLDTSYSDRKHSSANSKCLPGKDISKPVARNKKKKYLNQVMVAKMMKEIN